MNLIDILNQILQTKNQIKDIISESDDFSRYSTSIHNYLADIYNAGYVEGYSEKYEEEVGVKSYPEDPVQYKEYTSSSDNYDPFTSDGLVDIMSDVLGYRLDIKDELGTGSDYFPSYPDYLSSMINSLYNIAKNDGADSASEDINPSIIPTTPSISFSNNTFTLTAAEGEESVNLYYKIGEDGVPIRYTGPVTISGDVEIYYWSSVGKAKSNNGYSNLGYDNTIISDFELYPPYIYTENNTVYIKGDTDSETILYKIGDGDYQIYYGPFPIVEDVIISAISIKNNIISSENSILGKFIDPSSDPLPKCERVELIHGNDNSITMTCPTTGADIHYRIDDGSWNDYSSSFIISERCLIYVYSSKEGYRDSDIIYYPITPYIIGNPPSDPTFYTGYDGVCQISCTTAGAHIFYRIGNIGEYREFSSNYLRLYLSEDCVIYAFSRKDNLDSDTIIYNFDYISTYFNLDPPVIELINNRIVITSEYTVWYTLDGRDPRMYGRTYLPINDGFSGLGISGTTNIRAVAVDSDENYRNHFSNEVTKTFTPIEAGMEGYIPNNDFFNVRGASEIHLSGVVGSGYKLSYSYDKRDWIGFNKDVTGLDPTKIVYLQTYGTDGYKVFESISFGEGDRVTVAGNVLSIVMNGDHTVYEDAQREMTLYKLFYNCTQLVDAKDLSIPYKSLMGSDLKWTFAGCVNLINGPSNFRFTEVKSESLYETFAGCSSLKNSGSFNIQKIGKKGMYQTFKGCSSLVDVDKFNLDEIGDNGMESTFAGCSSLVKVSLSVNGSIGKYSFKNTFKGCSSLKNRSYINSSSYIDNIKINSSSLDEGSFFHTFDGCSSLDYFGSLPSSEGFYSSYEGMFLGCSSLKEMSGIGLISVHERVCYEMFRGCSSLEKAPELLSANLSRRDCYGRMFYGCSSLNWIKALFLTTPGSSITNEWVYGVAPEGTFIQDPDAVWFEESVNAIPIGWTDPLDPNRVGSIESISITYDVITITATNDNAIYYAFSTKWMIDDDTEWFLYTGPFQISANAWITARCKSNRGVYGNAEHNFCEISVPSLTISSQDNIVTISKPEDYEYGIIYYKLRTIGSLITIQDWSEYSGPFEIDSSYNIEFYGLKANGEAGPRINKDIIYGLSTPSITCSNNVVRITCSTPDIGGIQYNFDGSDHFTRYDDPFIISENCSIYARAWIRDKYTGNTIYSDTVAAECIYDPNGQSSILHIPILERANNLNQIVLKYDGRYYTLWDKPDIKIFYKMNSSEWKEYNTIISYNSDCSVQTYAINDKGVRSDTTTYSFTYDSSNPPVFVPTPIVRVINLYGTDFLQIESGDGSIGGEFYYGYIFEDGRVEFPNSYSTETMIPSYINKATIFACASKGGQYYSDYGYYDYDRGSGGEPVIIIPDPPVIRYNSSTHYVTIEATQWTRIKYSFDGSYFYDYSSPFIISSSSTIYSYVILNGQNSSMVNKYCEINGGGGGDIPEPSGDYSTNDYLTFEILEDYSYVKFCFHGTDNIPEDGVRREIEYSLNNGSWTTLKVTGYENHVYKILLMNGDKIRFRGDNPGMCSVHRDSFGDWASDYHYFEVYNGVEDHADSNFRYRMFNVCGNINSIIDSTQYMNMTTLSYDFCYYNLFAENHIIYANELFLPSLTVTQGCYESLFNSCSSLIKSPKSLPATTIGRMSYFQMFYRCSSIEETCSILPAQNLYFNCYQEMYYQCLSLKRGPVLPAQNTINGCYIEMFSGCTNLEYAKVMATGESGRGSAPNDYEMFDGVQKRNGVLAVAPNSKIILGKAQNGVDRLINDLGWTAIVDSN